MHISTQINLFSAVIEPSPAEVAGAATTATTSTSASAAIGAPAPGGAEQCGAPVAPPAAVSDIGYSDSVMGEGMITDIGNSIQSTPIAPIAPIAPVASDPDREATRAWCKNVLSSRIDYSVQLKSLTADPVRLESALDAIEAVAASKSVAYAAARSAPAPQRYVGPRDGLDFNWTNKRPALSASLRILAEANVIVDSIPMLPAELCAQGA